MSRAVKPAANGLLWAAAVLMAVYPAGAVMAACAGYRLELISVPAYAAVIAALAVCAVLIFRYTAASRTASALAAILAPVSLLCAPFCTVEDGRVWVAASVFLSVGCCCVLTVKHGKPPALKIVSLVLSGLLLLPIGFLGFLTSVFGDIGQNTVVQTVESPGGKYCAQVIDSDQGALGGATLVEVCEKGGIDAVIFKLEKKPQRVYTGAWGAYEDMEIGWNGDGCLVIDSVEYPVGGK